MIIQHNIMSLNAHRQLGGNTSLVSKNLEKLSSGFKINRAGDDAAGLAISEKMRSQITGLTRAQANAQDGISLVQTAEGALTEVHSMLNRMVDLATQSSNGTMQGDDRQKIQDEMDSLTSEIDRISQSTNFNGIKLLDGTMGTGGAAGATIKASGTLAGAAVNSQDKVAVAAKTAAITVGVATAGTSAAVVFKYKGADGVEKTINTASTSIKSAGTAKENGDELAKVLNENADFKALFTAAAAADGKLTITAKTAGKLEITGLSGGGTTDGTTALFTNPLTGVTAGADVHAEIDLSGTYTTGDKMTIDGKEYTFNATADGKDGKTFKDAASLKAAAAVNGITIDTTTAATSIITSAAGAAGAGLVLQIGDTADAFNKVTVSVDDMGKVGLAIDKINVKDQTPASDAIKVINAAIEKVSKNRSAMGALQNRLEHTINNIGVATENMTAAESRVRDVDMAKEMANFTKNNVLTQAAQAMLAQANQQPQQVLQLLR